MKLRVGGRPVGEVSKQALARYQAQSRLNKQKVDELLVGGIVRLIRSYKHLPGARGRFLAALREKEKKE